MKRYIVSVGWVLFLGLCWTTSDALAGKRTDHNIQYGDGFSLRLTVIVPTAYRESGSYPVIFALPPGRGDPGMVDAILNNYWKDEGDRRGYIMVSPTILGRSLETRGTDVLNAVFAWMDENLQYDKQRVTLAGQSNGGLGAFFVARMQPERFQSIVVLPGAFGAEGSLDMLRGKPIWLLVGERDTQWVELSKRTRDLLMLGGAEPKLTVVPGQGHVFSYPPETLYDWIELQAENQ